MGRRDPFRENVEALLAEMRANPALVDEMYPHLARERELASRAARAEAAISSVRALAEQYAQGSNEDDALHLAALILAALDSSGTVEDAPTLTAQRVLAAMTAEADAKLRYAKSAEEAELGQHGHVVRHWESTARWLSAWSRRASAQLPEERSDEKKLMVGRWPKPVGRDTVALDAETDAPERSDEPIIDKITSDDVALAEAFTRAVAAREVTFDPAPERSDEKKPAARLIVDRYFSKCSACNGNADPSESQHIHGGPGSGYRKGSALSDTNGCGAIFTERYYVADCRTEPIEASVSGLPVDGEEQK